jgi:Rrf2 family protein
MVANSRFAMAVHTLAALGYLHKQGVDRLSSRDLARSVNTNPVVIRNLVVSLKEAGLVTAREGRDGGVSLGRAPSRILLNEIYAAVGGDGVLSPHARPEFKACPVSRAMKRILPTIFDEVDQAVTRTLKGKSLQDLIDRIGI